MSGASKAEQTARHIESHGVPVAQLAKASGIPRATLTRRLANPRMLTLPEVDRIAAALDVSPWRLLGVKEAAQ